MAKLSVKDALIKADGLLKKGRTKDARTIYQMILRAQPTNAAALRGLKALGAGDARVVADPPQAILDEVLALMRSQDFKQAIVRSKTLLKKYPTSPNLWNLRALACNAVHRYDEAVAACRQVVALSPQSPEAYLNLGNALRKEEHFEAATEALEKALALRPEYPFAYNSLGNVQSDQSNAEAAIKSFSKAVALDPKYAEALYNLGNAQSTAGLQDEAIESFRATIALNPEYGKVYQGMASITKFTLDDPVVASMHALYDKLAARDEIEHRGQVCFALAKVYRDNKDYAQSFRYLKEGNTLLGRLIGHNPVADRKMFRDIRSAAPKIASAAFDPSGDRRDVTPIFILGMPRSGTTLTEQILACHSDVAAAGELSFVKEFGHDIGRGNLPPTEKNLQRFRDRYLEAIAALSTGERFVTDKMPHNFGYVGLIRKALPEAIIINLKRDPAAVCWSNFWQFFPRRPLAYSTDLGAAVEYHGMYEDLMHYWRKHLPDEFYTLDYDRLVVNQEADTRALIDYCGLPWEDACLAPHKVKRDVKTASKLQVIKPMYKGSSAAWKAFEPYLDGAFDALPSQSDTDAALAE